MLAKISLAATRKSATLRSLLLALLAALALAGLLAIAHLNPAIAQSAASAAPVTYQTSSPPPFATWASPLPQGKSLVFPPSYRAKLGLIPPAAGSPAQPSPTSFASATWVAAFCPRPSPYPGRDCPGHWLRHRGRFLIPVSHPFAAVDPRQPGRCANLPLQDVPALQSAFNAAVCPELLALAQQTGDLPGGAINPEQFVQQALNQFGVTLITDLISSPDHLLGGANLGEIQFAGPALDQLEAFTIGNIPELDQIEIADLDGWQDLAISDIPGLDQVPFGAFPGLLSGLVNGFWRHPRCHLRRPRIHPNAH